MKKTLATKRKGRVASAAQTKKNPSKSVPSNSAPSLRAAQVAAPGSRAAVVAMQRKCDQVAQLNAPLEVTPPDRRARLQKILRDMRGTDSDTQARRVLLALEGGPCTSLELRKYLDCIQITSRVHELRQRGFEIETHNVRQVTDAGGIHRGIALYVLRHGKGGNNGKA